MITEAEKNRIANNIGNQSFVTMGIGCATVIACLMGERVSDNQVKDEVNKRLNNSIPEESYQQDPEKLTQLEDKVVGFLVENDPTKVQDLLRSPQYKPVLINIGIKEARITYKQRLMDRLKQQQGSGFNLNPGIYKIWEVGQAGGGGVAILSGIIGVGRLLRLVRRKS